MDCLEKFICDTNFSWRRCRFICNDGFSISIQANEYAYCRPRQNNLSSYHKYELGFPSDADELIFDYAEDESDLTGTVYGYVPHAIVLKLIEKHGGPCKTMNITLAKHKKRKGSKDEI